MSLRWTTLLVAGAAACSLPVAPRPSAQSADTAGPIDSGSPAVDPTARAPLQLAFPLAERERFTQTVGVDHDPVVGEGVIGRVTCLDHAGRSFPFCYDEHAGSDFILRGGFSAMDAGSTFILAAADGVVSRVEDGNYDRCHGSLDTAAVDCDGHELRANRVEIVHPGGHRSLYLHMMKGSVQVEEGQAVFLGQPLGKVGSSGNSSLPHLHFELQDPEGGFIDPFHGAWSQPETWWCEQDGGDGFPGPCPD